MAFYRNHVVATEPYEDSQGLESPTETSPEELQAFYEDMERREILERKLSKRKSNSGTSMWSRKSLKRWTTSPPPVPPAQANLSRNPSNSNLHNSEEECEAGYVSEPPERNDISRLVPSRSVIGETNPVVTDAWASVPLPSFKVNYPLHNPFGPRRYRNHHLIPPSLKKPSMRPPTFFSPSFPPMHTSSAPEHLDDRPESTNTSHTPSDTPASSQTRVGDGTKPRSRKTSQTAPDNVDLLDVTDPWGTNWHHQSPYDIGQTTAATSDTYDIPNRARRASFTAMHNRNKSITPSPLSQSTSAVHLHPGQPEIHIPRKLSKRRTPTADNIFAPPPAADTDRKFTSALATPLETKYVATPLDSHPSDFTSLPKRMSVAPAPLNSPMYQTPKKEKRGSMLNRLAKKFSMLKRSSGDHTPASDWWHHVNSQDVKGYTNAFDNGAEKGRASPEKSVRESVKRVPPPAINNVPDPSPPVADEVENKRLSLTSLDAPISMGRLTITNPDVIPDSTTGTPAPDTSPPLPPEKTGDNAHSQRQSQSADQHTPPGQPSSNPPAAPTTIITSDLRSRLDKPLPPPQLETPDISQIRLSDIRAAQALEQLLPLPSRAPSPVQERTIPDHTLTENLEKEMDLPLSKINTDNIGPNSKDCIPTTSLPIVCSQDETTPKKSPSRSKGKRSVKEDSPQPDTPNADRTAMHTPVVPESRKESQKNMSPQSQPSRNDSVDSHRRHASSSKSRDRSAEASTSTLRAPTKTLRSNSRSDSLSVPAPVAVPFPTGHSPVPDYEGSPLSTSSMLANPPTPYDHRMSIATDKTPPTLPPKSIYEGKSPKDSSLVNPSPSRQTETFKLVRSSSGNVYASNQTITAAGEQWEVVESIEAKKDRTSSRPKDQEHRHRDREYRNKEHDYRSKDYERKSRDYDYWAKDDRKSREYDRYSRGYDRHSRDDKVREEYRAREEQMAREIQEESSREERRQREEQKMREERRAREERKAREERRVREERRARDEKEREERERERAERRAREEQREREGKERERERAERRAREEQMEREEKERAERRAREEQKEREEKERARQERRAREEQREKEEKHRVKEERKAKEDERAVKEELRRKEHERRSTDYESKSNHRSRNHNSRATEYTYRSAAYDHPRESEYKSKDFEPRSLRESKRESPIIHDVDNDDYHRSSRRSAKQPAHSSRESSNFKTLVNAASQLHDAQPRIDKPQSGSRRENYLEHQTERSPIIVETSSSSSSSDIYGTVERSEPTYGFPQSNVPHLRLERNTSLTARPTSELPSAAEMNAVRAKESWEMERLWKARSMYGLEPNAQTTNFIPGSSPSASSRSDELNTQSAIHGSSHTAYVVQTPFQGGLASQIYHSMPTGPPPIIYSSPASIPSIPDNLSSYEPYEQAYRSFATTSPSDYRSSVTMPRPPLANPLPEPPRESSFEIKGLKKMKSSNGHSQTSDYWTKYNGITTTH